MLISRPGADHTRTQKYCTNVSFCPLERGELATYPWETRAPIKVDSTSVLGRCLVHPVHRKLSRRATVVCRHALAVSRRVALHASTLGTISPLQQYTGAHSYRTVGTYEYPQKRVV